MGKIWGFEYSPNFLDLSSYGSEWRATRHGRFSRGEGTCRTNSVGKRSWCRASLEASPAAQIFACFSTAWGSISWVKGNILNTLGKWIHIPFSVRRFCSVLWETLRMINLLTFIVSFDSASIPAEETLRSTFDTTVTCWCSHIEFHCPVNKE
jgi:hypothetical protein